MRQALRWKSEKQGEISDCLQFYMSNQSVLLWRLLGPVPESMPDQGLERRDIPVKTEELKGVKRPHSGDSEVKTNPGKKDQEKNKKKCWICGKAHEPFCPLPEGYQGGAPGKEGRQEQARQEEWLGTAPGLPNGPRWLPVRIV